MVQTKKFSEFTSVNLTDDSNMLVGVGGGANIKAPKVVTWITSERPNPPIIGVIGYNTTILQYEYWDGLDWRQLAEGGDGTVSQINTGTGLTGGPITTVGSISFAEIAAESLWANTTGASAVPAVTALSTFLLSANNLSDVPNKSTARTNMGLAIGTNVQAWSAILDTVSAGTYIGDNSITTLGTVVFGTWNSVAIGAAYGGTGLTSTTAYGVITGGTTSTGNFQNVGTGTINQILSSQGNAALPAWGSLSALMDTVFGGVQGDIVYRNASAWTVLAPGTSGQFLQTQGAAQNPIWAPGDGAGTVTSITAGTGLSGGVITSSGTIALIAPVTLALGGTNNASLTASNGGIVWSDGTKLNVLAGTATAGLALLSGASTTPSWSTGKPITKVVTQVFTSSGTYTPTSGMTYCIIEAIGGGGAGGGATSSVSNSGGGGGAGAGGYSRLTATSATIGSSQTVTIGAGGTPGTAGNNAGGNGGDTSVGSLCIAKGGTGGSGSAGGNATGAGMGGVAGTGDFIPLGNNGWDGQGGSVITFPAQGGHGASSVYGGGGRGISTLGGVAITGGSASNYGSGGGGGVSVNGSGAVQGGAGSAGVIIITEFVSI